MKLQEIIYSIKSPDFWNTSFENAILEAQKSFPQGIPSPVRRVIIIGCGTSCYAGMYGAMLIERYAGLPCKVIEGNLGNSLSWNCIGEDTLFLGISNTGGSETVCRTMEQASKEGAFTVALTGDRQSRLAKACEKLLYFPGVEDCVPTKTRSYIETLMGLLATALVLGNCEVDISRICSNIATVAKVAAKLIEDGEALAIKLAKDFEYCSSITVVGSGLHLGNAYEASLKLCEMGWMNSAAFETENYMHGRFRSATSQCPYLLFAPKGEGYDKALDFLALAAKKQVKTVVITDTPSPVVDTLADAVFLISDSIAEELLPMVDILPAYLLGMHLGVCHGYEDPSLRHDGLVAQATQLGDLYPELIQNP